LCFRFAMRDTLLVIEDEDLLGEELARHFRSQGWEVVRSRCLAEAEQELLAKRLEPLVVLSDMSLPDGNALDLLEKVGARAGAGGEWVLLTGFGTIPDSVRALHLGAYEFLEKPCESERLDLVITGAARSARAQRRIRYEAAQRHERYGLDAFVGSSVQTRKVRELLARVARVPFSALIIGGETGTGKGLAARVLHYNGPRTAGPIVEVNCIALPSELLESELFGHEAGAFTGAKGRHRGLIEQAHGGTLFLDEIGEMSLGVQARLLKALEDRRFRRVGGEREISVDVQFIAASNRDLALRVQEGEFREDLYHRLRVIRVDIPPLRERREDIEDLVPIFVAECNAKAGKHVRIIPENIWERLRRHSWPGNVRELRNVIERCVLLAEDERLPEEWLQLPNALLDRASPAPQGAPETVGDSVRLPLDGSMALDDMEKYIIQIALERAHQNVTAAARALGTTRQTLRYRIQKYWGKAP
jgi:two-component system response regulator AtoC